MTARSLFGHRGPILGCLVAACCLTAIGCEGWPGGKGNTPEFKNPFARKESPAAQQGKKTPAKVGPDFYSNLTEGRRLEKSGKLDDARLTYQKLIVKYPTRHESYHRLGVVADRQKRYREAQALYTQAISIKPDPESFNDLGYCLYLQGKLAKAESALIKAVSMQPANARFRNNLGMVYGHQGRDKEAMEQFRRGGSEADAHYNMAFILAGRDDIDGAKDCFQLALASDPTHEKARNALQSFDGAEDNGRRGNQTVASDGRRLEPYIEGDVAQGNQTQRASYNAPATNAPATLSKNASSSSPKTRVSSGVVPSTRRDTQALLRSARTMMSERTGAGVTRSTLR